MSSRCLKIVTLNQPIDALIPASQIGCRHFKMPAYLCFHLQESLFSAYQRNSITHWYSVRLVWMCSLSEKLFQGIRDSRADDVLCQHIPFILYISESYSSKFHSISLETFKSGDTAEIAPCPMMFIASKRFTT